MSTIPKRYWKITPQPYLDYEVELTLHTVVFKEWWDPGRDPNRTEVTMVEFENSPLADKINYCLGSQVLGEILESIKLINSGK